MREEEKLFITLRGNENRERALESWAQRGAVPGGLGRQWAPLGCSLSRGLPGQTAQFTGIHSVWAYLTSLTSKMRTLSGYVHRAIRQSSEK